MMSGRGRPPPYNPGYGESTNHPAHGTCKASQLNQAHPPPLPQRRCSSLPRRVHRPLANELPPSYEEHYDQRPIGFNVVASATSRQPKARTRLPMSPQEQSSCFLFPSNPNERQPQRSNSPRGVPRRDSQNYSYPTNNLYTSQINHQLPISTPNRSNLPSSHGSSSSVGSPHRQSIPNSPFTQSPRGGCNIPPGKLDASLSLDCKIVNDFLQTPRVVHVSPSSSKLLLVDPQAMLVIVYQLLERNLIASFKVVGVQGGCFWTEEKLAIATHRGIRISDSHGQMIREITLGSVINTKPLGFGFIAIQTKSLQILTGTDCSQTATISKLRKPRGLIRRSVAFVEITDVAVTCKQNLIILDAGQGVVYVSNTAGKIMIKLKPCKFHCGALSTTACCVSVDKSDSIFISDEGNCRLLQFMSSGVFSTTLLSFTNALPVRASYRNLATAVWDVSVYGTVVMPDGRLAVVISNGQGSAEVRLYRL